MYKHFRLLIVLLSLLTVGNVFSQSKYGESEEECKTNLTVFYEYARLKNYNEAYESWKWCFDNCPQSNLNIYSFGVKIAEDKYEKAGQEEKVGAGAFIDAIYKQRIQYFPKNLGKVYSDWATSLKKRGASEQEVFAKLEASFKADPGGMSVKNMAQFFQELTDRNKDTNVQKIFDTYDDVLDAVTQRIEKLQQQLDQVNTKESNGQTLFDKERTIQRNNTINLKALGQVEVVLDQIVEVVATCERLIPLYEKGFNSHSTDGKWLRRAASRLNAKGCTENPIFPKLVEAFVVAEPSPKAYIYFAKVLEDRGENKKALEYRNKAVDLEKDPYIKAKYLYDIAFTIRNKNRPQARIYAKRALKFQPSMGKAYLLIANLYYRSANTCGDTELSKRMVFVVAMDKAKMAKKVDPSITARANSYIKSYAASQPTTSIIFKEGLKSGDPWTVKCWINETTRIP